MTDSKRDSVSIKYEAMPRQMYELSRLCIKRFQIAMFIVNVNARC